MSKTIGLIDDSKVMRSILRKAILMCNYSVSEFIEADNGVDGFQILTGNRGALDIAFVDLHMPKMGGLDMTVIRGLTELVEIGVLVVGILLLGDLPQ